MIKRSVSLLALLCGLLWSVHPCDAQTAERQVAQSLVRTIEMQYLLYLPPAYDSSEEKLHDLLNEIVETYRIDPARIYVTGLSMGGYATWRLACTYPERFAAVVPICGGGDPEKAPLMKEVPTWVFHGAKDEAVPLQQSQEMVDALKAAGSDVRFTVYPEGGHVEAWQNAYGDPDLWEWLAKQRRAK